MGLGQPFFLAIKGHWERLAEKYGFELKVYDGRFDAGTVQKLVDDVISDAPDAVAFAPLDSAASVGQVKRMLDAGIAVVTYNVQPTEVVAPRVFANDYDGRWSSAATPPATSRSASATRRRSSAWSTFRSCRRSRIARTAS